MTRHGLYCRPGPPPGDRSFNENSDDTDEEDEVLDAWVSGFAKGVTWSGLGLGTVSTVSIEAAAKDVMAQVHRTERLLQQHGAQFAQSCFF